MFQARGQSRYEKISALSNDDGSTNNIYRVAQNSAEHFIFTHSVFITQI